MTPPADAPPPAAAPLPPAAAPAPDAPAPALIPPPRRAGAAAAASAPSVAVPPAGARLDSLDLLRGVAVLGIFLLNSWSMGLPQGAYMSPLHYTTAWIPGEGFPEGWAGGGADYALYAVIHVFADMKFISLFSLLFGAGLVLQAGRVAARGESPWAIHAKRMAVLLALGMIHAYAFWSGDILTTYALCGLLLFALRGWPAALLVPLGLAMLAVVTLINLAEMHGWHNGVLAALQEAGNALNSGGNDLELAAYRGGWLAQMADRVKSSAWAQTVGFATWTFWRCGGLILIGMALQRWRFFQGAWTPAAYAALALLLAPAGWMVTFLGIVFNHANGWSEEWATPFSVWGLGQEFNYWGSLLTMLGYAAAGVLLAQWAAAPGRELARKLLAPLRAVGRMALSNYLLQTLIGTTLFYGHGFGMFGYLSRAELVVVVLLVWGVQLVASPLWLAVFRQGPMEWLWHRLVYGRGGGAAAA